MYLSEYVDLSVKLPAAFIIPLGWTIVLYPLIRKARKSWCILIIIASILSFFVFIFKEKMDKVTPFFDEIVTSALGIFFGLAAVSFFFNIKSRWYKALPKSDISFQHYKIKKKVHLRYLFQVAVLIGRQRKEFYKKLEEKTSDVNSKNLCTQLAADEDFHRHLFQDTLSRWLPVPTDRESLDSLIQELKKEAFSQNPSI